MKPRESAEELLEILWIRIVEDRNPDCEASALGDEDALKDLVAKGWIEIRGPRVRLTPKGREEAAHCIRRHRLAERLLTDVLDVRDPLVDEAGCEFEHLLLRGIDESICTLLGHPRTCPHGRPIPQGRCCREARTHAEKIILPLTDMDLNRKARIAYLHTHDREALQKLIAMGLLPRAPITLLQRTPSVVVQSGHSQFALDAELASHVYVRPE